MYAYIHPMCIIVCVSG